LQNILFFTVVQEDKACDCRYWNLESS